MKSDLQLQELGEHRIIEEVIEPEFLSSEDVALGIGDDCAILNLRPGHDSIVVSTDPCPLPVAWMLGDQDYSHYGWYTMIINVSDIASMGATPYGIMVATVMPPEMKVSEYQRFLSGLKDASEKFNCPIIGGNIKDGKEFTANGSIIGGVSSQRVLRRNTAKAGDAIVVIGNMGVFWSGVLAKLMDIELTDEYEHLTSEALTRPRPKIMEGQLLAEFQLANSCMDSSDGLLGCFLDISKKSGLDAIIEDRKVVVPNVVNYVAERARVDILKLALSWGDWQLVCSVPREKIDLLRSKMEANSFVYTIIGYFEEGTGRIFVEKEEGRLEMEIYHNERFTKRSYFSHGLQNYIDYMKLK